MDNKIPNISVVKTEDNPTLINPTIIISDEKFWIEDPSELPIFKDIHWFLPFDDIQKPEYLLPGGRSVIVKCNCNSNDGFCVKKQRPHESGGTIITCEPDPEKECRECKQETIIRDYVRYHGCLIIKADKLKVNGIEFSFQ